MSKQKSVARHLSIRLADDVAPVVADMARLADWSEARLINSLCRAQIAVACGRPGDGVKAVAEYRQAVFEHGVRVEAEDKIKAARKAGRDDADQMMLHEAVTSAEQPAIDAPAVEPVTLKKTVRGFLKNRKTTAKKK